MKRMSSWINEFAGRTPLRMVLQKGRHIIEGSKAGFINVFPAGSNYPAEPSAN
jgi:hypothetical protein